MQELQWRRDWREWSASFPGTTPPPPHPTYDVYSAIDAALAEDAGGLGDLTAASTVPATTRATATFVAKASGVAAGVWVATAVCKRVDPSIELSWNICDGSAVGDREVLGRASGPARSILVAERVALNFMLRAGGIASAAREMVEAVRGTETVVLDTRKTVPGLRLLDKWAVVAGGAQNHRMGLYDMLMIKDNHVDAGGGIPQAVAAAQRELGPRGLGHLPLEVETRTLDEVRQVVALWDEQQRMGEAAPGPRVTRVMLDNMTKKKADGSLDTSMLSQAMELLGDRTRGLETEASGNVTLATVRHIAETGVQFISCGSLTHSVTALDVSLVIETL